MLIIVLYGKITVYLTENIFPTILPQFEYFNFLEIFSNGFILFYYLIYSDLFIRFL